MPKTKKLSVNNIAIVSDTVYPYFKGGKEKRIYEISTRLASAGYDVHIYTMKWWDGPKDMVEDGVNFHAIDKLRKVYMSDGRRSIVSGLLFGFACLKLIRKPFDIIDVDHMPYMPLFSIWLVCKMRRKKMYATWHEVWSRKYWNEYLGFLGIIAYFIERVGTLLPDRIIVDSDFTRKRLALRHPNRRGQLMTAYNGLDLGQIAEVRPHRQKFDIMYAGRLMKHKNVPTLIKAVGELSKTYEDVSCVIIGDGPEKENLKRRVTRLGLDKHIKFLGFLPKHEQVYSYMKASKAFILPSEREGFGLVVLEANACGLPVLTLDHPENAAKELIQSGVNGFVFKDHKDLADKLDAIMRGEAVSNRLKCAKTVQQYNWQNTVDYVLDAYAR